MNHQTPIRTYAILIALLCLLIGCAPNPTPAAPPGFDPLAPPSQEPATPSPDPGQPLPTPSPTSCTGWNCTLEGIVYLDSPTPGNELAGATVDLDHISWCSPTAGRQHTTTGPDGIFSFEVYLHDTDTFWFEIEWEGYQTARVPLGGFDCLFCICPPVEVVLVPLGGAGTSP